MFKAQVIILAGGEGSRLRPYTTILPKPLLPLGDVPIIEILIRQLRYFGLKNIVISTGYLGALIQAYCGDGKKFGVKIAYVHEEHPLGTAGALKLVKNVENNFLVLNGDVLTDLDFSLLLKWHIRHKAIASIAVKERRIKSDFGVIEFGPKAQFKAYHEKPEHHSFVSLGINAFNRKAKDFIEAQEVIGMPDLMHRLKSKNQNICCYETKGQWLDLGRFEDLERAQDLFIHHKKKFILG